MKLGDRVVIAWGELAGALGAVVRVFSLRRRDEWAEPRGLRGWRRGHHWIAYDFPIVDVRLASGRLIAGLVDHELVAADSRGGLIRRMRRDLQNAHVPISPIARTREITRRSRSPGRSAKSRRKSSR